MLIKFKVNDKAIQRQLFANGVDLEQPYNVVDWTSSPLKVAKVMKLSGEEFTTDSVPAGTKLILVADKTLRVRVKRGSQLYFEAELPTDLMDIATSVVAPRRYAPGYEGTPHVVVTLSRGVKLAGLIGMPMILLQLAEQGV